MKGIGPFAAQQRIKGIDFAYFVSKEILIGSGPGPGQETALNARKMHFSVRNSRNNRFLRRRIVQRNFFLFEGAKLRSVI